MFSRLVLWFFRKPLDYQNRSPSLWTVRVTCGVWPIYQQMVIPAGVRFVGVHA